MFIYPSWGFQRCSFLTYRAMRRPTYREASNQTGSTSFLCISLNTTNYPLLRSQVEYLSTCMFNLSKKELNDQKMRKKLAMLLTMSILCACSPDTGNNSNSNESTTAISTAVIKQKNSDKIIKLDAGSTFYFTENSLIISTEDGQTKIPLSEITTIVYHPTQK